MSVTSDVRPPRVDIPGAIWNTADQLGTFIARLALEHGLILTFAPRVGPLAGRANDRVQGPACSRPADEVDVVALQESCRSVRLS